ncbi:MAG: UDP-N-acetylmuramoyl-L-alanyl-D-glutamate--2,6-diaminopimelate ligase, partial [Leifsonia sp.]
MTGPAPSSLRPEHPVARPLAQLVAEFGLDVRGDHDAGEVNGATQASKAVETGDQYVGVPGTYSH